MPRPFAQLPDFTPTQLAVEPLARAETIPSSWYTDPGFHTLDREAVFGRSWQGVGHVNQLGESGRYLVAEAAGNPVIVVRGKDGALRGFYNVCRHRGGPLALEDGCATVLQCKYHGWTYTLSGSLRGVPRFDRVELFDKSDYGLVPVRVETWQGLVFVTVDPDAPPVADLLSGLTERVRPSSLETMQLARRVDYEVLCNWKVYVDNYLEGYHVPFVHPELCKLYEYQHYTTVAYNRYSVQSAPLVADENVYTAGGGEALYVFVFPNFMLNILPGRLQTNLVTPLAPDRCRVTFWYHYHDVSSEAALRHIEEDVTYSDAVQQEDMEICAHVQRGLGSAAYDRGRFSVEQEEGVWHFQKLLKEAYAAWRARGSAGDRGPGPTSSSDSPGPILRGEKVYPREGSS